MWHYGTGGYSTANRNGGGELQPRTYPYDITGFQTRSSRNISVSSSTPSLPPNFLLPKENVKNRVDHSSIPNSGPIPPSPNETTTTHTSRFNMDLVPRTATQKWPTSLWFHYWRNSTYTNTLTTNTNVFLFMHQDPTTGGPRTAADTLSLLPLTNQPATEAQSFFWRRILAQLDKKCPR